MTNCKLVQVSLAFTLIYSYNFPELDNCTGNSFMVVRPSVAKSCPANFLSSPVLLKFIGSCDINTSTACLPVLQVIYQKES